ncbi:hypothetical protein OUZ56_003237 [Daphnia magna]|uniref:Uncharacterized protein n=1 Tax=Daphnia magna TaxID=35525 RepID=A0ABR0A858_9CRUS|nr:hypothetical protein OUZ56_003237 [Daphnia magna]
MTAGCAIGRSSCSCIIQHNENKHGLMATYWASGVVKSLEIVFMSLIRFSHFLTFVLKFNLRYNTYMDAPHITRLGSARSSLIEANPGLSKIWRKIPIKQSNR